jgi:hypothetical protein
MGYRLWKQVDFLQTVTCSVHNAEQDERVPAYFRT